VRDYLHAGGYMQQQSLKERLAILALACAASIGWLLASVVIPLTIVA
jgi:hypothetical protein